MSGRISGWVLGILSVGVLAFGVLHFSDLESFGQMLRQAQPLWLLAAVGLQVITYMSVSLGWKLVLDKAGSPLGLTRLIPVAISKLFADAIIPAAGMGGNVVLVDRLVKLGGPRGAAVAALLITMIGYYAAFAIFALLMLLMLWLHGKATPLLVGIVTAFLLVALAIPSLALWLRRRGSHPLSPFLEHIPIVHSLLHVVGEAPAKLLADRSLLAGVAACNATIFLVDAATLQVCLFALGHPTGYSTAFIALMGASILAALAPIPMGLGSFEAGSTAMLSLLGIPVPAALAGTLLLRGFTLWLPLLPGLMLMRGSFRQNFR
ncbi:lysylphosphatidylglycerol synthase transmembrane domain-containing protein [Sphingomonas sp. 10B4]|uniref:lysylphosphatidylglycerol synthase transmembrane domain-containing protein n=1 Tax=Sphingomonas sp. 10B4 TaxID=3048575 RepID=UPI002AB4C044|nr:lysylphosphatidylglycerol synthase transmembrane domain-containing protein [Sphingomonas sp. 10B4]MDY7523649.1 lysylphosphatidylglycerol synthase transmembrane domain-containing protein [Sphingomonas sp. 10B4]